MAYRSNSVFLSSYLPKIWNLVVVFHAFYISVYNFRYEESRDQVNMVCKIFTNDLNAGISHQINRLFDVEKFDKSDQNRFINAYVNSKTSILINGHLIFFKLQKIEITGEGLTSIVQCYFVANEVPSIQTLTVTSDLLLEVFDDQVNIVHLDIRDESKIFNLDKRVRTLKWSHQR